MNTRSAFGTWPSGGVSGAAWSLVADSLKNGSLAGFTARAGAWASVGGAVQCDDGTAEAFLSCDAGSPHMGQWGYLNATAWAAQVEFSFTAASVAASHAGLVIWGMPAVVGNGFVRVAVSKDGTYLGADTFGAGGPSTASPLGAIAAGAWHTLTATVTGHNNLTIHIDGAIAYQVGGLNIGVSALSASRVGPWAGVAHASFRNFKTWDLAVPA